MVHTLNASSRFTGLSVNPFAIQPRVSLKVRNFNSDKLKVNDAHGNPIEIAAVAVWKVVDSAKALFDVDNYEAFVAIQSETAIRALASRFPYDAPEGEPSLRGEPESIAHDLGAELQERLNVAGVEVMEARLTHLAYAPEIAQAMLRRQQAQAIIAALQKIVEGAAGMVRMALDQVAEQGVVSLDEERKAALVNNLLVALVSESEAQPVLNTGTLYQEAPAGAMAEKKKFLLRLDPELYAALERWAADELRSINAQIEFLLREAGRRSGRLKPSRKPEEEGT